MPESLGDGLSKALGEGCVAYRHWHFIFDKEISGYINDCITAQHRYGSWRAFRCTTWADAIRGSALASKTHIHRSACLVASAQPTRSARRSASTQPTRSARRSACGAHSADRTGAHQSITCTMLPSAIFCVPMPNFSACNLWRRSFFLDRWKFKETTIRLHSALSGALRLVMRIVSLMRSRWTACPSLF